MDRERVSGTYAGSTPQKVAVRLPGSRRARPAQVRVGGRLRHVDDSGRFELALPAAPRKNPCAFEILRAAQV